MTEYLQHQERLKNVIVNVTDAIQELQEAREACAKYQALADPHKMRHSQHKLEQAERRAEEVRKQLLAEANESQEQQVLQNLQELQNAMDSARQF